MPFTARYDLGSQPSTYDFFTWLVHVSMLGATKVTVDTSVIRENKWPVDETRKRLFNYILPGPALAGLGMTHGLPVVSRKCGSIMVQDLMKLNRPIRRLKSVLPPRKADYTVTLRETFHNPHKNSDRAVWTEFAEEIGATIIEDHSVQPIDLYDRVALYAGAKMNFGVVNGPMTLCSMTPYPCAILCDPVTTAKGFIGHGIKIGEQYPYTLPNQRLFWEKPTVRGLMRIFEECQ